jgi:lipid-binding SYLF domain-containing protein
MNNKTLKCAALLVAVIGFGLTGCQTAPKTEDERSKLVSKGEESLATMKAEDSSFASFIDSAYGYAVYPTVGEGGLIVGGSYGKGNVYERGKMIGYSDMTQASVGAQVGGQAYTEVIAFENKDALDKFISGEYKMAAEATATALKSGAAAKAKFQDGIAVFTYVKGGLMAKAAIGGQRFRFTPVR